MTAELIHRLHFAFTITFHYLFPQLTMGLGLLIVVLKSVALKTGSEEWDRASRFWGRIFAINFVFGVVTGIGRPVATSSRGARKGTLANEILEYREESRKKGKDTSPDAFIFQGRFGGPMDSSNFRHRVLHKLARELELPKLTFQVIRRTIATLGKTKGHPQDIQGLMRHSRLTTTMEIYMQSLEKDVRSAINSIYDELVATGTEGPTPQQPTLKSSRVLERSADGKAIAQEHGRAMDEKNTQEGEEKKPSAPLRGMILQFAGKMRANGLGGDLLND